MTRCGADTRTAIPVGPATHVIAVTCFRDAFNLKFGTSLEGEPASFFSSLLPTYVLTPQKCLIQPPTKVRSIFAASGLGGFKLSLIWTGPVPLIFAPHRMDGVLLGFGRFGRAL